MLLLRIGTTDGIATLAHQAGEWRLLGRSFGGHDVNVLRHAPGQPEVIFAGTYGQGLFRSTNGGGDWTRLKLEVEYVRSIAFAPDPRTVYVGTEPANLYCSADGGDSWEDLQIRRVPGSEKWSLPYSPRRGALRTLFLPESAPGVIYGGVEQGGVLKSTDRGQTWSITNDGVDKDVHWLSGHPEDPEIIFAATGDGTFRSRDGGREWQRLSDDYTRAVAVHPLNPQLVFAGPARDVGEGGRIMVSRDGGGTWAPEEAGIESPLPDMVQLFAISPLLPDTAFAILSEGGLLHSGLESIEWRWLAPRIESVQTLDLIEKT